MATGSDDEKSNTPEQIAYRLLEVIASHEKKVLRAPVGGSTTADRQWLLDTYSECLIAVRSPETRRGMNFTLKVD